MKVFTFVSVSRSTRAGAAAIGLMLAAVAPSATSANPSHAFRNARPRMAAETCSGSGTDAFLGSQGSGNVAAAAEAAVLGGQGNEVCDVVSSIAGGMSNSIGARGYATNDLIGAGTGNDMAAAYGAIMAGKNNAASADGAFVGAGGAYGGSTASGKDAFIGGGDENVASGQASVVAAGLLDTTQGANAFSGGGSSNLAMGDESFTGSGQSAFALALDAFVGAGSYDQIATTAKYAFAGSGVDDTVSGSGSFAGAGGDLVFVAQGLGKPNVVGGNDSFVGAGDTNSAMASEAFLGSGATNTIATAATYGSLIGGRSNTVSGLYGTVIGGYANTASGQYAIVAGGNSDAAAGILTFAAGYHADAAKNGSFVWSDYVSGSTQAKDTAANQFLVRASGGTTFFSNEAATAGVRLAAGSGAWASTSDRNAKTGIVPLDDAAILRKVTALPLCTWRYKTEGNVRHMGPMAQDFYAAFDVGEDDTHIATIDEDGVALAAIKALHRENTSLRHRLGALAGVRAADGIRAARTHRNLLAAESELRRLEAAAARAPR